MDIQTFIVSPIAGAIIGYFTNWLAIKMLFRPYKQKTLLGRPLPFTPGLIPKERLRLAEKMGDTVGEYLLTDQVLTEAFANSKFEAALDHFIDDSLHALQTSSLQLRDILPNADAGQPAIRNALVEQAEGLLLNDEKGLSSWLSLAAGFIEKLPEEHPGIDKSLKQLLGKTIQEGLGSLASIFVNEEKVYLNLKKGLIKYLQKEETAAFISEELLKALPVWSATGEEKLLSLKPGDLASRLDAETVEKGKSAFRKCVRYLLEKGATHVVEGINIRKLVEDRINEFEVDEAERIILSVVKKELNAITIVGGVLGFVIGLLPAFLQLISH